MQRWLSGDRDIAIHYETAASEGAGEAITLGGVRHRTPARYALAAAQEQNWGVALEQLTNGELLTWLEQKQWDEEPVAEIRRLANDGALLLDERLMVVPRDFEAGRTQTTDKLNSICNCIA